MSTTSATVDAGSAFERYRHDVYGWAYRLLGRHHDALDVAQDVFLRWLSQYRRRVPEHPRGWLRTTTINRAIDVLRSRQSASSAAASMPRRPLLGPARSSEIDELRADIAAALATLTESQRGVLVAKVYDGLTFAAIAAEQKLAVPTVKTHYLRALGAVQDRLEGRWSPDSMKGNPHES